MTEAPDPNPADATPKPDTRPDPARAEATRVVKVLRQGLRGLYRSQIPRMAAALAYRTIFAILPVCVIALVVFGAVVSDDDIEWGVSQILDFTKLSDIALEPTESAEPVDSVDTENPDADSPEPAEPTESASPVPPAVESEDESIATNESELANTGDTEGLTGEPGRLDEWITNFILQIRQVPKTAIGLVSGLFLIYAAIGMLVEVERAFNHIYRCVVGRRWWNRITLYWTMLTLGTILLGATFVVGQRFHAWVIDVEASQSVLGWIRVNVLGFVATAAISTLLLTIAYTRIPNTRVKIREALIGAIVAAVLWEAGKWGFTQYVSFSTNYARLYGSLALIPLFMLWIYVTWMIVLSGLQVAYALQTFSMHQERIDRGDDLPRIIEPEMVLAVMNALAAPFERGSAARLDGIAEDSGVPEAICTDMVEHLERLGFVRRIDDDDDEPSFIPAKPTDRMKAVELISAIDSLVPYDAPAAVLEARRARHHAFGEKSLQDIMSGPRQALED